MLEGEQNFFKFLFEKAWIETMRIATRGFVSEESAGRKLWFWLEEGNIFIWWHLLYGLVIINAEMITSYQGAQTTCSSASPLLSSSFLRNIGQYLPPARRREPFHISAFHNLFLPCLHLLSTDCGTLRTRIEAHTTSHLNSSSNIFLGSEISYKNMPMLSFCYF